MEREQHNPDRGDNRLPHPKHRISNIDHLQAKQICYIPKCTGDRDFEPSGLSLLPG
jgi:hypothetical protein